MCFCKRIAPLNIQTACQNMVTERKNYNFLFLKGNVNFFMYLCFKRFKSVQI